MSGFTPAVAELIIAREQGRCALTGVQVAHLTRGRDFDLHHRRPRGSGGTSLGWVNQAANGVLLSRKAHDWVEKNRTKAFDLGFLVSKIGVATAATTRLKHHLYGWVLLDNEGGYTAAENYGREWAEKQHG